MTLLNFETPKTLDQALANAQKQLNHIRSSGDMIVSEGFEREVYTRHVQDFLAQALGAEFLQGSEEVLQVLARLMDRWELVRRPVAASFRPKQ